MTRCEILIDQVAIHLENTHVFELRARRTESLDLSGLEECRKPLPGNNNLIGTKKLRDNPLSDRFIEVGTKALRRELMSGETLRAPRQQLRRLRASAFDLFRKSKKLYLTRRQGAFSICT